MRVFITGIAGMIGFHVAKLLKSEGHTVFGIDSFNDFYDVKLKRTRSEISQKLDIPVYDDNILEFEPYDDYFKDIDVVLHLAAYCNPRHSLEEPYLYINNNITGTQRLIDSIENTDIPVVYASSSCVSHGQPLPWKESDNPDHQNSPYGWTKRANECQFKSSNIVRSIGLRFFTVYGPYGRPDMALFKFTKNILENKKIDVYNYGNMKRDFTYVDDIVSGIKIILDKIVTDNEQYHDIYNIGYGKQVNLMDFVNEIELNLGKKAKINLMPAHPGDVPETWSDTTKLQKLGYKPTTSIKDGIKEFISWYKSYYGV